MIGGRISSLTSRTFQPSARQAWRQRASRSFASAMGSMCITASYILRSIGFPRIALQPLLITMIINGQKRHAMPIRAGRSRMSHKGMLPRFMRPIIRPQIPPPIPCQCSAKCLAEVVEKVGVPISAPPKLGQAFFPKLGAVSISDWIECGSLNPSPRLLRGVQDQGGGSGQHASAGFCGREPALRAGPNARLRGERGCGVCANASGGKRLPATPSASRGCGCRVRGAVSASRRSGRPSGDPAPAGSSGRV